MTNRNLQNQDQATGLAFARNQRSRDAASALEEYRAGRRAVDENTARLRALRLARDAAASEEKPRPAKKTSKKVKRVVV